MRIEIVMPKMGESLQEGTIVKWLKSVGSAVERDEMILEISTDKVDTEVPSPVSGILAELLFGENETVEVGKVIGYIETDASVAINNSEDLNKSAINKPNEKSVDSKPESKKELVETNSPELASSDLIDIVMPKMGESLQEGTIIKWLKNIGDNVERDEMLLEISTDKVDTEVPSPANGILAQILFDANTTVEVGTVIARISSSGKISAVQSAVVVNEELSKVENAETIVQIIPLSEQIKSSDKRFYSPVVKAIAIENNISDKELATISGTGNDGRVTKKDILSYLDKRKVTAPTIISIKSPDVTISQTPKSAPLSTNQAVPINIGDDDEIIPMDRVRRLIAEHMVYSKHTSAHVTSVSEADITNIVKFRNQYKDEFEKREGIKLTYTPFFAKAAIEAIKTYPNVNVSVDGTNIIKHRRLNLSVATALDDGNLIVPVIKNADALSFTGIARSIYDLSSRARNKKLNPDDIQGGTFTITNVGTFGTLFGTPVINQPQTGIMGIGAIKKRPVVKEIEGEYVIVIRDMVYVSITYDHRVIDGMLAGKWLSAVVENLEKMNNSTISL